MKIGTIKIRPVILVVALGLVAALNITAVMLVKNATTFDVAVLAAVIAFASNIVTAIVGISTKLIESEEKGQ